MGITEKFTPGPWKFEPGESAWIQSDSGNADICEMPTSYWEVSDFPELYANASLIAAAPELYEALQAAEGLFRHTFAEDGTIHKQMIAALAKARGEQV